VTDRDAVLLINDGDCYMRGCLLILNRNIPSLLKFWFVNSPIKIWRIGQIAWYFHYTKCQWVKLRGDLNENTIEYFQQFAHICIAVPSIVELCWGATP